MTVIDLEFHPKKKKNYNQISILPIFVLQVNDTKREETCLVENRQVLLKIDEIITPSSTMLQQPSEKIKTKGRPKIDSSTHRLPFVFEMAKASLIQNQS